MQKVVGAAIGAALLAAPFFASAAPPAAPAVAAAPLHTAGAKAVYPRLTRFPDAKIMAKVNAALADQEKTDRQAYADCVAQVKEMKMKPDADTYFEDVTVRYLTPRYLSVEVVTSYFCAGAYPTNGAQAPVTFDLATGNKIDWNTMFKPGFMGVLDNGQSVLTKLYLARYSKKKEDAECLDAVKGNDPAAYPIFWLDAKQGLMVQPDYPHVMAACAVPMALAAADIAPYLKSPALAADLKSTVRK